MRLGGRGSFDIQFRETGQGNDFTVKGLLGFIVRFFDTQFRPAFFGHFKREANFLRFRELFRVVGICGHAIIERIIDRSGLLDELLVLFRKKRDRNVGLLAILQYTKKFVSQNAFARLVGRWFSDFKMLELAK